MTEIELLLIPAYFLILFTLVKPLGGYMAQVYEGKPCVLDRICKPCEKLIYRVCGIKPTNEMDWKSYLIAMLLFNFVGIITVYMIQRIQFYLPLNPQGFSAPSADLAFNTAISFVTNTNWQSYSGELTMSYLTQMMALAVQNFLSAATGMAILIAFIRGLIRHETDELGNFWVDMVRGTLYILLPLASIFSIILVSQGVIQNFKPYQSIHPLQSLSYQHDSSGLFNKMNNNRVEESKVAPQQLIPMGPVASQIAIKQLGTNGGGYFNTNAAHPFENPNGLTNFLEMLAILLIPASLCYSFGVMINDKKQGWTILLAMSIILVPFSCVAVMAEQRGNPALKDIGIKQYSNYDDYANGNMEGKETRFGITNSALWAAVTTAASNGSVNAMLDSFMPLGGLVSLWMMHLGEVVFGGVGSGLYCMLVIIIITVFVSGLMVGRTPEYLGKKIEPFEMKMASFVVLVVPFIVLIFSATATATSMGIKSIGNPGAHGFTEIIYAFSSMGSNNGSAYAGLKVNTLFYNTLGGIAMLFGRYWVAIPILAISGSLAQKKLLPSSAGTLATHTPIFIVLLISVIIILGGISFLPALALGPVVEHIMLWRQYGQ